VTETQNQVLALILETTEKINQCPSYLQNKLQDLQIILTFTLKN